MSSSLRHESQGPKTLEDVIEQMVNLGQKDPFKPHPSGEFCSRDCAANYLLEWQEPPE